LAPAPRVVGQTVAFNFKKAPDLGNIKRIRITSDGTGFAPGWFLDTVVVEAPSTGKKWTFVFRRWLEDDHLSATETPAQQRR
jgi:hypothetical protein